MNNHKVIDSYISKYPKNVQYSLQKIRQIVLEDVPGAEEKMTYGVPACTLNGKTLLNYAAFAKHIGLYPGPDTIKAFSKELQGYETAKGTIRFPIDKPIPYDLIKSITKFCIDRNNEKNNDKKETKSKS